jgi:glutamine phosphoribosylpyrophosphate amidotransferase
LGAGITIYRPGADSMMRIRKASPRGVLTRKVFSGIEKGDLVLFHHRLPTSTPNVVECNHPIASEDGSIHLVHNGWITGYREDHRILEKRGHTFETRVVTQMTVETRSKRYVLEEEHDITDSEVLVHYLEDGLKRRGPVGAVTETVKEVMGAVTFGFVMKGMPDIVLYRGSPGLSIFRDKAGNIYFASERPGGFRLIRDMAAGEIGSLGFSGYRKLAHVDLPDTYGGFFGGYGFGGRFDDAIPGDTAFPEYGEALPLK